MIVRLYRNLQSVGKEWSVGSLDASSPQVIQEFIYSIVEFLSTYPSILTDFIFQLLIKKINIYKFRKTWSFLIFGWSTFRIGYKLKWKETPECYRIAISILQMIYSLVSMIHIYVVITPWKYKGVQTLCWFRNEVSAFQHDVTDSNTISFEKM